MSIHLQFLGATQNVTGSCYLLEVDANKILVDCGLFQEKYDWSVSIPQYLNKITLNHWCA